MIIESKVIPHKEQRYNTVGDYMEQEGNIQIKVSDLGNSDMNFLLTIHEAIESYLCKKRGISFAAIDEFDKNYKGSGEPGNAPGSPYDQEHLFAEIVERWVAMELGVDWQEYENKIKKVSEEYGR